MVITIVTVFISWSFIYRTPTSAVIVNTSNHKIHFVQNITTTERQEGEDAVQPRLPLYLHSPSAVQHGLTPSSLRAGRDDQVAHVLEVLDFQVLYQYEHR